MNLSGVREGDLVECDVRGRRFFAQVRHRDGRKLAVTPITPQINYFEVTARQVVALYRRSRKRNAA